MVYIALGSAIISVCAWITVPYTVPFTMQTFGVFCVCGLLGGRRGFFSVLIYVLLGAAGIPVFSGFRGGAGVLVGVTGGYITGFHFTALACLLAEKLIKHRLLSLAVGFTSGLALCYTFGSAWFALIYASESGAIGFGAVLLKCVVPFLPPDAVKLALALALSMRLQKYVIRKPE